MCDAAKGKDRNDAQPTERQLESNADLWERRSLTQVEVIHAVSHQDVVEESQTWVVNAFVEACCSVCSVYIFFCKDDLVHEAFSLFTALTC